MTEPAFTFGKFLLGELATHPEALRSAWEQVLGRTFGLPYPIMLTGHKGVGKTVLLGNLVEKNYPDGESSDAETEGVKKGRTRYVFTTVPGSHSPTRRRVEEKLFGRKGERQGIIYLFANGYVTRRRYEPTDAATPELVADIIARERASEVEELTYVLEKVCRAQAEGAGPSWLVLLHAKADLYADKVGEFVSATREGRDDLSEKLNRVRSQLGSDNFNWGVAPISVVSDPLRIGGTVIDPKIDPDTAKRFMEEATAALGGLAHGR